MISSNRHTGSEKVTTIASRVTWNEVTKGTPNLRIFAVMHISDRPPGDVARIMVDPLSPSDG